MDNINQKKMILIALNEINFDIVKQYINAGYSFPNLKKITDGNLMTTSSESDYDLLEPWIQWPSVHTGKTYREHKIFRLGDIVSKNYNQIFETLERLGFSVGAISPMNAKNNLKRPAYFIPDPWTKTKSDPSIMSKAISSALVQSVNDNSQSKLEIATILKLMVAFAWFVRPTRYKTLVGMALKSRGRPWRKALFLDLFLNEIHRSLLKRKRPNFSTIFLNAGAHIQHHYFFNSKVLITEELKNPNWYIDPELDPVSEALAVYDAIIGELIKERNTSLIIATGLSQKPYRKLKFYYRLKDHSSFLKLIGVHFKEVFPRMTRDFEVTFSSKADACDAERIMSSILVNNEQRLFGEIENRDKSLFVVLDYPNEVRSSDVVVGEPNISVDIFEFLVFVAIKNGEHQGRGFAYYSDDLRDLAPSDGSHVAAIHDTILKHFNKQSV